MVVAALLGAMVSAAPAEEAGPDPVPIDNALLKGVWKGDMVVKKGKHRGQSFTAKFTLAEGDFSSVTGLAMVEIVSSRSLGVRGRRLSFELSGRSDLGKKVPFRFIAVVSDDGTTMEGRFDARIAAGTFKFTKQDEAAR